MVRTPQGSKLIAHTHPSGVAKVSVADQAALNYAWDRAWSVDPAARVPHSRIIYGPGPRDSFVYYPTNR